MTQKRDRFGRLKKKCRQVPTQRRRQRQTKEETMMTEEERLRKQQRLLEDLKRMDDAWLVHQRRERRQMVLVFSLTLSVLCLLLTLSCFSE